MFHDETTNQGRKVAEETHDAVIALGARFEDFVYRFDELQKTAIQTMQSTAKTSVETRAIVDRLDKQNHSIEKLMVRVDETERKIDRLEDDSESRKLSIEEMKALRSAIDQVQVERIVEVTDRKAREEVKAQNEAKLRPYREKLVNAAIGMILLAIAAWAEEARKLLMGVFAGGTK